MAYKRHATLFVTTLSYYHRAHMQSVSGYDSQSYCPPWQGMSARILHAHTSDMAGLRANGLWITTLT